MVKPVMVVISPEMVISPEVVISLEIVRTTTLYNYILLFKLTKKN